MLIRKCLIGSIIFHILILGGAGFWLRCPVAILPAETYLQIYNDPEIQISISQKQQSTMPGSLKPGEDAKTVAIPPRSVQAKLQRSTRIANIEASVVNQTVAAVTTTVQNAPLSKKQEFTAIAPEKGKVEVGAVSSSSSQVPSDTVDRVSASGSFTTEIKGDVSSGTPSQVGQNGNPNNDNLIETDLTDVDVRSVRLDCPIPKYPPKAKMFKWEGIVTLEGELRTNGKMEKVKIVKSSGYDDLDQAARLTIKCWRYRPAWKDGKPITCHKRISVTFKLEG